MITLETPLWKWASSRLEGRTSRIFSSCGRCPRLTTGPSGIHSGGLRKGQSRCELLEGLSGLLCRRCRGLRPCVESLLEPEDFSPMLTWILGYFWRLPWESVLVSSGGMHVRLPPKLYQQCHASLHVDQGICGFTSRLSHEAFPRGFPTGLSHVPPWCDSILGLKVEAVQGKQVSLELTETSGGLWEWWHDLEFLSPLLFRAPPLEIDGNAGNSFRTRRERIPPLELGGGNTAHLNVSWTLVLPLEWRRVCRGTS